jgi:hypothetical protein
MSEQLTDTTSDHLANHLIERLDPAEEEQLKESFRLAHEALGSPVYTPDFERANDLTLALYRLNYSGDTHLRDKLRKELEENWKKTFVNSQTGSPVYESETLTENRKNWAKTFANPQMENL